ncbi:MAG: ImmA/IrrE family metallo-endopeptidase [Chloroflexota bacterium]
MLNYGHIARQADELRERLRVPDGPIPDIVGLLRQMGLKVVLKHLGRQGPDGMYIRRQDLGFVLLNGSKYLPRFRFTAAHEAGHHALGHSVAVDQDVTKTGGDPQERAANSFAAALLMPESALRERTPPRRHVTPEWVLDTATEFGVSYEALVYRLHNCSLLYGGARRRDVLLDDKIGVLPESLEMPAPPAITAFPVEYVRRAVKAYSDGAITLERLAELIETDPGALERLFTARSAGDDGGEAP